MTTIHSTIFGTGIVRTYASTSMPFKGAHFDDHEHPTLEVYSDGSVTIGGPGGPLETTTGELADMLAEINRIHGTLK